VKEYTAECRCQYYIFIIQAKDEMAVSPLDMWCLLSNSAYLHIDTSIQQ
jgi:hypothetical protein